MCELSKNYDLVVGSRYVNIKLSAGLFIEKLLSKYANLFAKSITKSNINDLTTDLEYIQKT